MAFFLSYLRERRGALLALGLCTALFCGAFALYGLPVKAAAYPAALCLGLLLAWGGFDYARAKKKHARMQQLLSLPADLTSALTAWTGRDDRDYGAIIASLTQLRQAQESQAQTRMQDMLEYYTIWVHQIKTPIAAMRLQLQSEDTPLSRRLTEELSRIEQYVEMVLCYLRLDAGTTDYVFREYALDTIVRQAVRRFAGQFIRRGLRLTYEGTQARVVTDEKWLLFVLEQVLSNALKYTGAGGITIYMETPDTLCVRDTGIGIAPEDLPRIFEKGYTGYNGRADKKASGLGLYLCRRICGNLGHGITVDSAPGQGTTVRLGLHQERTRME